MKILRWLAVLMLGVLVLFSAWVALGIFSLAYADKLTASRARNVVEQYIAAFKAQDYEKTCQFTETSNPVFRPIVPFDCQTLKADMLKSVPDGIDTYDIVHVETNSFGAGPGWAAVFVKISSKKSEKIIVDFGINDYQIRDISVRSDLLERY